MFLTVNHYNLDVFKAAKELIHECYRLTGKLPREEIYGLVAQIRRASTSVLFNISEGASRTSPKERSRFFEVSRGSVVEIDTAIEICTELGFLQPDDLVQTGYIIVRNYQMLSRMIKKTALNGEGDSRLPTHDSG